MRKRIFSTLLAVLMCIALLPNMAVSATETGTADSGKTLMVGSDQTYATVQEAINYIYDGYIDDSISDPTGWTILIESGTYNQFAIPKQLDGLTVCADEDANVTIATWTGASSGEESGFGGNGNFKYNTQGYANASQSVYVQAENVTFKGLNFTVGTYNLALNSSSVTWYKSAITDIGGYKNGDTLSTGLTVKDCTFTSVEQGYETTYPNGSANYVKGIMIAAAESWTVTNCTFDGFSSAVCFMCDTLAVSVDGITVTNNIFTNCDRAMDGYYGGTPDGTAGTLIFSGNLVTGTSSLRSKIVVMDQASKGSIGAVDITNNTFNYTMVLVENMAESSCTVNNILSDNTFGSGSYYVEGDGWYYNDSYNGTITVNLPDAAYYESPEGDEGYWKLNIDLDELTNNSEGATAYVQEVIAAANASGSHTLSFTWLGTSETDLLWTVTAFKDCIYWVSGEMPTDKVSEPGLDKTIVLEDGTEVEQDDVAAGDTVSYKLTSNVPSNLVDYIDYSAAEGSDNTNVIPLGTVETYVVTDEDGNPIYDEDGNEVTATYTYTLTFHDVMNSALSYKDDAKVTLVKYELDEDGNVTTTVKDTIDVTGYANVTTDISDNCTFEVTIDLLALYSAGKIVEADFGSAEIIVTYSATLSEDAAAGAYENTAWVTYPDGESEKGETKVDTYGISVFKYNQSDSTTDAEGNTTYAGLADATFELRIQVSEDTEGALTDSEGNYYTVVATLTSDEDGYATYEGLDAGTYYLVETKAPNGYVKADTVLTIIIPAQIDKETNIASVSFANAPVPSTGGMGTTIFRIVGVSLLLAAGAVYVFTLRRRKED